MEPLDNLEKELGRQFGDAPRELKATISLAMRAIQGRSFGEALNELKHAQELVDNNQPDLSDWRAETAAAWALYYYRGGPELKSNEMWRKIALAQRLEPDNKRLDALIDQIQTDRARPG